MVPALVSVRLYPTSTTARALARSPHAIYFNSRAEDHATTAIRQRCRGLNPLNFAVCTTTRLLGSGTVACDVACNSFIIMLLSPPSLSLHSCSTNVTRCDLPNKQYGLYLINELFPSQVAYIPSLALRSAVYFGHVVGMGKPFLRGGRGA